MPASPTLPDHFDQEARLHFLYSFLNPDIDQFRVAELAGLKLSEYFAYINSEEFQERLAQQTAVAEQRARACATLAQPKAVATLTHIIDSYNEAERDILLGRQPIALNIRQRHRESARRASWLILKLTGAIPTHLRAARPIREQSTPDRERGPAQAPLTTTLSDALTQYRELAAAYPASQLHRGESSIEDPPRPTQHRRFAVANSAPSTQHSDSPTAWPAELIDPSTLDKLLRLAGLSIPGYPAQQTDEAAVQVANHNAEPRSPQNHPPLPPLPLSVLIAAQRQPRPWATTNPTYNRRRSPPPPHPSPAPLNHPRLNHPPTSPSFPTQAPEQRLARGSATRHS